MADKIYTTDELFGSSERIYTTDELFAPAKAESGIFGTLGGGAIQTARAVGAFADLAQGDTPELQAAAAAQAARVKDPRLAAFEADLAQRREQLGKDPGWLDVIGEVGSAAWKNPSGAGLMAVDQLPNSAAVLAGGGAGALAGSALGPAGTAVGGVVGGIAGMFAGNLAVEGGNRALEHVGKTGGMTDADRSRLLYEGAIKAGVITGVDAATFGMTKFLTNATRRAVETATLRVAEQAGVSATEISARRAVDPVFDSAVASAQKLAIDGANTFGKRALQTGAALGLETIGEGLGEYLGEFAATGEADKMDAVIEAFSSLGQSAAEVGIAKVWNSRNPIAPITTAQTPDDAIAAADAALSAPIDTLSSTIDAFKSEWAADASRVPADSALPIVGGVTAENLIGMQATGVDDVQLAPPTASAIVTPDRPIGPALIALAEQLSTLPAGEQTKALMRLDSDMRQRVVQTMRAMDTAVPSGLVVPAATTSPGMGEAVRIMNEATVAASSVQPVADIAVTNVPALTQRAAQEIVSKSSGMEMRPHREVPGRFEVVPIAAQPATQASLVPPTLPLPTTQQALAEQEGSMVPAVPAAPAARPMVPAAPLTAEQLAANQAAADAERSSLPRRTVFQNSQLRSETGPDIKGEKVTRNMRKVLAQMGRITGTKVVFEYAPQSAEGAVPMRGENTIHINTAAQINPLQVMGHEVTHVLRDRHAAAWAKVRDALVATMPDKRKALEAFAANYWGVGTESTAKLNAARAIPDWSAKLTPEQKQQFGVSEDTIEAFLIEEMVSDLGGQHWSSEKFWLDVFAKIEKAEGAKAKGIIERLVIAIRETLTKFLAVVRAQKQDDYSTVTPEQIEATRDAITSAYAQFIRAERRTEPDGEPHVTDHRISTSDTHSRTTGSEPQPAAETPAPVATGDEDELESARAAELAQLSTMRPVDTSSAEFREWFGSSKVVDADGKPLKVYHGTGVDIEAFVDSDFGTWLTSAIPIATTFAERNGSNGSGDGNPVLMPLYVSASKVKFLSLPEYLAFAQTRNNDAAIKLFKRLRKQGYQAVNAPTMRGDIGDTWIVLDQTSIKSAISNTGEFSKTDPRISYSTQRLFFEAAPNPDDKTATQQWREAGRFGRGRIDAQVRKVIVPGLLKDLRVTGEIVPQLGGWMDATNPSFALIVRNGDPALAARAIGYVLDQQAMYMLGLERFTGAEKTGIIHFDIAGKDAHKIYMQVRALDSDVISGHSTVGNEMYIGVPADRMQTLRQSVVEIARTNDLTVSFDEGYGATLKEYGYGIQGERQVARGLRATARDVNRWRAEADALRSDAAGRTGRGELAAEETRRSERRGAVSAVGIHYSQKQREYLASSTFGTGLKGAELERVMQSDDPRIKHRIYFYTNSGNGIRPESGVGAYAHRADLTNLYDGDADPRDLTLGRDANEFESAVLDAGYDGYITHERGVAVLLGPRSVQVQPVSSIADTPVAERATPSARRAEAARIAARKDLPSGRMTGAEWKKLIPEATHLADDKTYYKSALTGARMSEARPPSWWYSPLARAAETATMKKAPASGWKSWLKSLAAKGVKPDEIKWSGIEDWLDVQGEATVTKEQVQSYLSEFGVKIETILRGESNPVRPVTDSTQDVEDEDSDIELNVGDWETDEPDDGWLNERANERLGEEIESRVDNEWEDIADEIQRHARVRIETSLPDIAADVRREMGDMFPVEDELVEQVARNYAAARVAGDTWKEYTTEEDDLSDEDVQRNAVETAFAVLSGDMEVLEIEARRRARAEINDDTLLEGLIEQEYQWYYNDHESPQTRRISVDGVDGYFYDSTSYGERSLYYEGRDIPFPRRADDADVEGAIREYVIEEGLIAGRSGDIGGYRSTKWDGYTTDKNRAVPGSYREVQLTLPIGAFAQPLTDDDGTTKRKVASDFYYTAHWSEGNVIGHARFDEHIDGDGKRVLVLQEVQGDWGQQRREGLEAQEKETALAEQIEAREVELQDALSSLREKLPDTAGFNASDWSTVKRLGSQALSSDVSSDVKVTADTVMNISNEIRDLEQEKRALNRNLPDAAPFIEKTPQWAGLVLKRMIAHAIEYGFDKVVWTTGAQQVERWKDALRKEVDTIKWEKTEDGIHITASLRGRVRTDTKLAENALSDAIGKVMAKQIIADPNQSGEITGDDITISDTGMAGFYDRMLPNIANDILRKFDKDVRVKDIEVHKPSLYEVVDLSTEGDGFKFGMKYGDGKLSDDKWFDRSEPERLVERHNSHETTTAIAVQQGFEITDKLRESVANGVPLFSQRRASSEARMATARKEWYRSQLSEAVGNLPAKIRTGREAALWLQSNAAKLQVKKDELQWSGILDWLATQRSVTGAQIQDWLASNGVRVNTVMLSIESDEYRRLDGELQAMDGEIDRLRTAAWDSVQGDQKVVARMSGMMPLQDIKDAAAGNGAASRQLQSLGFKREQLDAMLAYGKALNRKNELFELRKAARGEQVKWNRADLNIAGGRGYRELLLVLPRRTPEENTYAVYGAFPADGFASREDAQKYIDDLTAFAVDHPGISDSIKQFPFRIEKLQTDTSRAQTFVGSHYPQPNILAHVRFDERTDADGKRVLFIQEVQSDFGQAGRAARNKLVAAKAKALGITEEAASKLIPASAGFRPSAEREAELRSTIAKIEAIGAAATSEQKQEWAAAMTELQPETIGSKPPSAPFVTDTKSWVALALKRMIAHAVDNGFDRVAWTTGEQQSARYDLSKQVSRVELRPYDNERAYLSAYNLNGARVIDVLVKENEIEDHIGKEAAKKLLDAPLKSVSAQIGETGDTEDIRQLTGLDLKIGGEGMVAFYDGIVKQVARSLGATVDTVSLPNPYRPSSSGMTIAEADANLKKAQAEWKATLPQPGFDITDKMREQVAIGMPLFSQPRPALDQWLGRSVVRKPMYHGTARDITTFRPQQADAIFLTDDPEFAANFADMSHSWMLNNFWMWMSPEQIQQAKRDAMRMLLQDALPGSSLYMREERMLNQSQQPSQYMRRAVEQYMPSGSNIMPLYVRAENPFDYRNPEHVAAIEREIGTSWMGYENIHGATAEVAQHIGDLERGDWNAIESQPVQDYIRAHHDSFYVRERGVTNLAVFSPNQVKSASGNSGAYSREDNDIRRSEQRALRNEPQGNRTLDATELQTLRRDAADLERPRDGIYLTVMEDGRAIATGLARKKIPDTFRRFADKHDLMFVARRRGPGGGMVGEERGEPMLAGYRQSGARYSAEIGDGYIDRTDRTRFTTPRSRITGQPINQSWTDPIVTDWDDFVRKIQDNQVDTKRVLRAIRDAGVAIAERFNPYLMETDYHGRAASRVKAFTDGELRKLLEDMNRRSLSMEDLDDYLWARHAAERNAANAKTNPAITDGSGLSDTQAADILAGRSVTVQGRTIQLSAQSLRAAAAVAGRVDAITNGTLDLLVSYGLEKQSTIDTWKRTYAHYVPLKRDMESDANYSGAFGLGAGTGSGFDVRGGASRRALGSKRMVTDILANVAMQRERAITRGEKNRVSQAVYGLALTAPNPEFWIPINTELNKRLSPAALAKVVAELVSIGVNPIDALNLAREPVQRYIDPKTGLEMERINPALRGRDDVLSTRINGEDRYVMFSNKKRAQEMVRNLKNLDAPNLSGALQVIAPVTRWFAAVNTQYNPIFGLTNGLRDLSTGMLNLSSTPLSGHRAEIARNAFSALKGIYLDLRDHRAGRAPTSQWAQLFEQFQADGGQTGYKDMFLTSADRAAEIADELKQAGNGQRWLAFGERHSVIFGWLSDYNTSVENAMRLSAYKAALDNGMSRDAAASLAKNLTVNFNKKGLAAVQTGALYAFFNAAVQGTARIAEATSKDGKLTAAGQKIVYGGMMVGVLQAVLGMLAGWDDEEPPQFQREKNFIIPIPGSDKYINVPMPLGFHVLPNIGRITTELLLSGGRDPGKRLLRLANVVLDAFNPIGSGTFAQTLSPTVGDPIIALAENEDWTGKPIYKEDFSKMQPTAGWTRTKDTASPPSRWLAYALNYITGGGKYEIGAASPTPDQIDYLVGQTTGGVGRELLKTAQYASSKVTGEELPIHKTPLGVGRFVGETKGQASETSRFYSNLRRIGEHKSALDEMREARDGNALMRYLEKHPDARLVQVADKAQREIGYLRRQKRELIEKGGSKERVRMIEDKITGLTRRYNEVLAEKR